MIKTFYTREGMILLHSPSILRGVLLHTLLKANTKYHSTQNECAEELPEKGFPCNQQNDNTNSYMK